MSKINPQELEALYQACNKHELISPDPLEFLYAYETVDEREVVGLISSSLAYGNVMQILKSGRIVLNAMGPSPREFALKSTLPQILKILKNFKHRWHTGQDMAHLIEGIGRVLKKHGSIGECVVKGIKQDENILGGLNFLVQELGEGMRQNLVPAPKNNSACKRLLMYSRWMVRQDAVDPGGWEGIQPSQLVVPLDVHMFRACRKMGMTRVKQPNLKAALEITQKFKKICPEDPVRYDFALTRLGIRRHLDKP